MFAGLGVGYLFHFGYFKRIEMDPTTATRWEQKMPFKKYTESPSFVKAGGQMGGEVLAFGRWGQRG
jgi:hypothetical protein